MTVGEFSRLTQITARALRHYDTIGVLVPAAVDASTGYRYYRPAQASAAHRVRTLRELGLQLEEIRDLLEAPRNDVTQALARRRDELQSEIARDQALLARLEEWITTGEL